MQQEVILGSSLHTTSHLRVAGEVSLVTSSAALASRAPYRARPALVSACLSEDGGVRKVAWGRSLPLLLLLSTKLCVGEREPLLQETAMLWSL